MFSHLKFILKYVHFAHGPKCLTFQGSIAPIFSSAKGGQALPKAGKPCQRQASPARSPPQAGRPRTEKICPFGDASLLPVRVRTQTGAKKVPKHSGMFAPCTYFSQNSRYLYLAKQLPKSMFSCVAPPFKNRGPPPSNGSRIFHGSFLRTV